LPDSIVCFKTQNETIKQFTFLLIRDAKEYLDHIAPSTAQKNINLDILSNLPIPLPPIEEQSRIIAKVDELMLECDNLMEVTKKSMMEGQKLLESVLGKMFNN
jgi:type I restriction enzyme S subunit